MSHWAVVDSLYCAEQFFCSHLDSYSHYLSEAGEDAQAVCLNIAPSGYDSRNDCWHPEWRFLTEGTSLAGRFVSSGVDVAFFLDGYGRAMEVRAEKRIAQVAAVCSPMPWEVRKPDGSPVFDLVLSSIPAMVDQARAAGCRAEYQPLAFDLRARACMMGVKRDLDCVFIGSTGGNHVRRTRLLEELKDVVTVLPPVFGREYFRTLARAKVVLNVHAEWARGAANAMRLVEGAGMGCAVVSDGDWPCDVDDDADMPLSFHWPFDGTVSGARQAIGFALESMDNGVYQSEVVLAHHTYECADRVPRLIELARSP